MNRGPMHEPRYVVQHLFHLPLVGLKGFIAFQQGILKRYNGTLNIYTYINPPLKLIN